MSIAKQIKHDAAMAKKDHTNRQSNDEYGFTVKRLQDEVAYYKRRVEELHDAKLHEEIKRLEYEYDRFSKELLTANREKDRLAKHVRKLEEEIINHTDRVEYLTSTNDFLNNEVEVQTGRIKSLTQLASRNQEVSPYLTRLFIQFWQTLNKDEECKICCGLLEPTKFYLSGCGHYLCTDCRKKLDKCPECRHPWGPVVEPNPSSILDQIRNAPLAYMTPNPAYPQTGTVQISITDADHGWANYTISRNENTNPRTLADQWDDIRITPVHNGRSIPSTTGISETTTFTNVDDVIDQHTRGLVNFLMSALDNPQR
jgi:hypothetical protein